MTASGRSATIVQVNLAIPSTKLSTTSDTACDTKTKSCQEMAQHSPYRLVTILVISLSTVLPAPPNSFLRCQADRSPRTRISFDTVGILLGTVFSQVPSSKQHVGSYLLQK